jgi:hypothetical protein
MFTMKHLYSNTIYHRVANDVLDECELFIRGDSDSVEEFGYHLMPIIDDVHLISTPPLLPSSRSFLASAAQKEYLPIGELVATKSRGFLSKRLQPLVHYGATDRNPPDDLFTPSERIGL